MNQHLYAQDIFVETAEDAPYVFKIITKDVSTGKVHRYRHFKSLHKSLNSLNNYSTRINPDVLKKFITFDYMKSFLNFNHLKKYQKIEKSHFSYLESLKNSSKLSDSALFIISNLYDDLSPFIKTGFIDEYQRPNSKWAKNKRMKSKFAKVKKYIAPWLYTFQSMSIDELNDYFERYNFTYLRHLHLKIAPLVELSNTSSQYTPIFSRLELAKTTSKVKDPTPSDPLKELNIDKMDGASKEIDKLLENDA